MHQVALASGASAEFVKSYREKLNLWFNTGEAVWMAAQSLAHCAQYSAIEERADAEVRGLRRLIALGRGRQ